MENLYEKLEGQRAIDAVVDKFYEKVMADGRIKHFFKNTDMKSIRTYQKLFLSYVFGGMPSYPGTSLRDAHKSLVRDAGLADSHFNAVLDNRQLTLQDFEIAADLIDEVIVIAESVRAEVLNK